jgi:hypothetical protein
MADEVPPGTRRGDVFDQSPTPHFRRNPDAPFAYSPMVDVRKGQNGLHLLSFVAPAAAPPDVRWEGDEPHIDVWSQAELLVPFDAMERLIRDLSTQFKSAVIGNLMADAAAQGMELPPEDEIVVTGLEDIFAIKQERDRE